RVAIQFARGVGCACVTLTVEKEMTKLCQTTCQKFIWISSACSRVTVEISIKSAPL
ncbi:unnamed protein product, partial [Bubo scandiacus]